MAEYRFIKPHIWSDSYFYNLTNDERLAFIWLFTNERTTTSGIYPLLPPLMAAELKITVEEAERILQKFEQDGKILYRDGYVWVKNFLRHQIGSTIKDNRFKKVLKEIEQAPPSIKNEFLSYYSDIFEAPSKPLQSPFKAPSKGFQNKEKEKEKEKNNNNTHSSIEHEKSIDFIIVKDDLLKLLHQLGFPRKSFRSKTDQEALQEILIKCEGQNQVVF